MTAQYIEKICKSLDIEIPAKNKDKSYSLKINEEIEVKIWILKPGFYFHGVIIDCPQERKEELFTYLMRANLLGQGTANNRIGLDNEEKLLTLSRHIAYEISYTEFKETLEDFVNYILYWRREIEKHKNTATIL